LLDLRCSCVEENQREQTELVVSLVLRVAVVTGGAMVVAFSVACREEKEEERGGCWRREGEGKGWWALGFSGERI
jgi:hypothetical protein